MGSRRPVELELARSFVVERGWLEAPDDTGVEQRPTFEHLAVAAPLVFAGLAAVAGLAWALGPVGGAVGAATPLSLVGAWRLSARRPAPRPGRSAATSPSRATDRSPRP